MKIVKLLTALLFVTTLTYIVAIPEKTLNYSQRLAKKIADLDARIEAEENVNMRAELEAQRDTCQAKLTTRKASNCKASKTHRAHRIAEGKPSREPKITICKLKDLIDAINGRLQIETNHEKRLALQKNQEFLKKQIEKTRARNLRANQKRKSTKNAAIPADLAQELQTT